MRRRSAIAAFFDPNGNYSRVNLTTVQIPVRFGDGSFAAYLAQQVREDLERKMVFVAGPRQVGKTTLARNLPGADAGYLNWDAAPDRERILRRELPDADLWVFDEIHKYRGWRNYLKGLYDQRRTGQRILVAGSGRLEVFGFGGDSLQGRYNLLRLHPFSVAEAGIPRCGRARGGLRHPGGSPTRRARRMQARGS